MNSNITYILIALTLGLVVGCSSHGLERVEADFGNSVNQMVQGQIYDPEAAAFPDPEPPMTMDGIKADNALNNYHKDVGDPKQTEKPIMLQIDR